MRKGLIATAVAVVLFAIGAFAAQFTVSSEDVASGSNAVEPCADNVEIGFDQPTLVNGVWRVTTATATFSNDDESAGTDCNGGTAQLALEVDGATSTYGGTQTVAGAAATFDLGTPGVEVEVLTDASVAVNGIFLD